MSKKPAIDHDYNHDKDRFEITVKRFDLKKKRRRRELIDIIFQALDPKSRKRRGHRVKDPIRNTRLEEVGD